MSPQNGRRGKCAKYIYVQLIQSLWAESRASTLHTTGWAVYLVQFPRLPLCGLIYIGTTAYMGSLFCYNGCADCWQHWPTDVIINFSVFVCNVDGKIWMIQKFCILSFQRKVANFYVKNNSTLSNLENIIMTLQVIRSQMKSYTKHKEAPCFLN